MELWLYRLVDVVPLLRTKTSGAASSGISRTETHILQVGHKSHGERGHFSIHFSFARTRALCLLRTIPYNGSWFKISRGTALQHHRVESQADALVVLAKGHTGAGSEAWILFSTAFDILSSFRSEACSH